MKIKITEKQYRTLTKKDDNNTSMTIKEFVDMLGAVKKIIDDPKKSDYVSDDVKEFFKTLSNIKSTINQQKYGTMTYQKNVETLQIALSLLGYSLPNFGIDGLFGPETARAMKRFLLDRGVEFDTKKPLEVTPDMVQLLMYSLRKKDIKSDDIKKYIDRPEKTTYKDGDVNSPDFREKLNQVASNLGVKKEWLIKVMKKESSLDPHRFNQIGCVGLIQFCPDKSRGGFKTIGGKKYSLQEIGNMSAVRQLDLVEDYYRPYARKIKSYADLYTATFYPAALGKSDNFILGKEIGDEYAYKVSKQNAGIAKSVGKVPGEPLTLGDFKDYAIS